MDTFVVSVCPLDPESSDFGDVCALYAPFLHQLTMQSSLFERGCPVLVVVCVARKLRPCPSYRRRRDRINLGLWRSLYKGGGTTHCNPALFVLMFISATANIAIPSMDITYVCSTGEYAPAAIIGPPRHQDNYIYLRYMHSFRSAAPRLLHLRAPPHVGAH